MKRARTGVLLSPGIHLEGPLRVGRGAWGGVSQRHPASHSFKVERALSPFWCAPTRPQGCGG